MDLRAISPRDWAFGVVVVVVTASMKTLAWREQLLFRSGKLTPDPGTFFTIGPDQWRYMYKVFTYSKRDIDDSILLFASYVARLSWLAGLVMALSWVVFPRA